MKKVIKLLICCLLIVTSLQTISAKSIQSIGLNVQIVNNGPLIETIEGKVVYGSNGIDIIGQETIRHIDTDFEVLKLEVLNDIDNDGYLDYITFQNTNEYTDQVFIISGKDGKVINTIRLTHTITDNKLGNIEVNSYINGLIKDDSNVLIIYDYELIRVNPVNGEIINHYHDEDNIWDVEKVEDQYLIIDQLGSLVYLDANLREVDRIVFPTYFGKIPDTEVEVEITINPWDIYYDGKLVYITNELGQLIIVDQNHEYITKSLECFEEEKYIESVANNINYYFDHYEYEVTNIFSPYYKGFKIIDDNDQYLLIGCYFQDIDCLSTYIDCFSPREVVIVDKKNYKINRIRPSETGAMSACFGEYEGKEAIITACCYDNIIRIGYYNLEGEQLQQKEYGFNGVNPMSKFTISNIENGCLLQIYRYGICKITNEVNFIYDSISYQLLNSDLDNYTILYTTNGKANALVNNGFDGKERWRLQSDDANYEGIIVEDFNNDGIKDYIFSTANKNKKGEVVSRQYIVVDGKDGHEIKNSTIRNGYTYDDKGNQIPYYFTGTDIRLIRDLDSDNNKELIIDGVIISSKSFKIVNYYYLNIPAKGDLLNIGDANGDLIDDYVDFTTTQGVLFLSKVNGYNINYYKSQYQTTCNAKEKSVVATILGDINNDGAKEIIINNYNSKGYQVFDVVDGKTLTYMYTIMDKGVSDIETYVVLDQDLNDDGYNEIYGFSGAFWVNYIIDGKTGKTLKYICFDSFDDYEPEYQEDYYYHPEYPIINGDTSSIDNMIYFFGKNSDIYLTKMEYNGQYMETYLSRYDRHNLQLKESFIINSNDYNPVELLKIENSEDYCAIVKTTSFDFYDLKNHRSIAEFNVAANNYVMVDDKHLIASNNENIYLLDTNPSFKLTSEVKEVMDEHVLRLSWEPLVEYSTMSIYDNGNLVYCGIDNKADIELLEGEHNITLALNDNRGKSSKESYYVVVQKQNNVHFYILILAIAAIATSLYINLNRKLYVKKQEVK